MAKSPPRLFLLLAAASAVMAVVIIVYMLNVDCAFEDWRMDTNDGSSEDYYDTAPDRRARARHARQIRALRAELLHLQAEVERQRQLHLAAANGSAADDYCRLMLKQKLEQSEAARHAVSSETEADVMPYVRFTASKMYPVQQGLGKRVVERPIGAKREEITEVVGAAVNFLNANESLVYGARYQAAHFLEGIYRTQDTIGSYYELYFRSPNSGEYETAAVRKVTLFRPFGELAVVGVRQRSHQEVVNVVLSLSSGRLDSFARFLEHFAEKCIKHDRYIHLTVVYVGDNGLELAQELLQSFAVRHTFRQFSLELAAEAGSDGRNFSRGAALDQGVRAWRRSDDVLVFLCDVDVVFNAEFLRRCRLNAQAGARVYFPIVFSLYNPAVVYTLHGRAVPSADQQLVLTADAGFWRDFGYGMTCQYRSDFLRVGGFSGRDIEGWGVEDVLLFRKYVRLADVAVVRATDPDIFHVYHEKKCDVTLPDEQYRGCIRSKALTEASHQQLGLLAFKNEIDAHNQLRGFGPQ